MLVLAVSLPDRNRRPPGGDCVSELLECRLLGTFRVRTSDGTVVEPRAWRTSKTRDLFRMLAVAGRVVPADRIVDALWPDVDPQRGRASLRTAASQVRQVIGEQHLARHDGGFELTDVWVDATAFTAAVTVARQRLSTGDRAGGVAAAWEAVTLYSGDLCEDEPYADWVVHDRDRLRAVLRQLLLETADAACELGWLRDASELAHRALDLDPIAERAYRSLMRVYGRLGETEQALRLYEQCRRALADELGADPGELTRAVHLELLRAEPHPVPRPPFVGRQRWLDEVEQVLALAVEESRPATVLVTGAPGVGRSRFLEQVASRWPHRVLTVPCGATPCRPGALAQALGAAAGVSPGQEVTGAAVSHRLGLGPVLVLLDDLQQADAQSLDVLTALVRDHPGPLVAVAGVAGHRAQVHPLDAAGPATVVDLPPLSVEEVAELLTPLLLGPPAPSLVDELSVASRGVTAEVVRTAQQLVAEGSVLSTPNGMVRMPRQRGDAAHLEARLARVRELHGAAGGDVVDLLAVLDRPTTAPELTRLSGADPRSVRSALDQLCDLRLVVQHPGGFRLVDALAREQAYQWLRPTVRRELHRRVAESARLPAADRSEHWLRSGEPVLACAAALEAADEALASGDAVRARAHLRTVAEHAEQQGIGVDDRIGLCERLVDVARRTGRPWEAQELCERAIDLARRGAPQALPRLHRLLGRCATTPDEAVRAYTAALRQPSVTGADRRRSALAIAAVTSSASPAAAYGLLEQALIDADDAQDVAAQVEARVLLAGVRGQRRDFDRADRAAREAMVLAETAGTPAQWVRAAHALVRTAAFLGDGLQQLELLRRVRERSLSCGDPDGADDVALTHALVLHDLGDPEFEAAWDRVRSATESGRHALLRQLLEIHLSVERGQRQRASRLLAELPQELGTGLAADAASIVRSRLLLAEDPADPAAAVALEAVLLPREQGPSMLGPEAAARLAVLRARSDPGAARCLVDLALALTGQRMHPRERVCLLQARAALLARDDPGAAATMALAAARTAGRAGLVLLEADARDHRAELLAAARRPGCARAEAEGAAELRVRAGHVRRGACVRGAGVPGVPALGDGPRPAALSAQQ